MTNPEQNEIGFDRPMLERLKKAHAEAKANDQSEFTFEDNLYYTPYAGYLIEYLDAKLPK